MHDAPPIAARRHRALMMVRTASLALFVFGGIPLTYNIALALVSRDLSYLSAFWGDTNWLSWGIALLAPAITLYVFDRRIVRWLIPVPRRECHECGYPLQGLHAGTTRCPECGIPLSGAAAANDARERR